jgi:ABC-type sugar transport system ATPase subunit
VGVRPQDLRVGSGPHSLALQVDVVEYLGTESQVVGHLQLAAEQRLQLATGQAAGQRVTASVPGDAKGLLHGRLALGVDATTLHVFDTASGQSLRP